MSDHSHGYLAYIRDLIDQGREDLLTDRQKAALDTKEDHR